MINKNEIYNAINHYHVNSVVVVGSIRFIQDIKLVERHLTRRGITVFAPVYFDGNLSDSDMDNVRKSFIGKLESAESMLIMDVDGCIGEHTKSEIEYFSLYFMEYVGHKPPIIYYSEIIKNKNNV